MKEIRCKECEGLMYEDGPSIYHCYSCKRSVKADHVVQTNEMIEKDTNVAPRAFMEAPVPSHGLVRKEELATDAYMPEAPEFPFEDDE